MRKNHSKIRKVLPLVLGLAVGGSRAVLADNAVDNSIFNTTTGDFVFVTDYMHKINRNENTNLDELIRGGNITRIYAVDPSEAIRSRMNFLNSARAKEFYSEEQRLNLFGRYQKFLSELGRQKISPSAKSLDSLSYAVMDGEITPEEVKDVEDNVYAIVKEGIDKKFGPYSVFYLTSIVSDKIPSQYQEEISRLEKQLEEISKSQVEKETPELSLEKTKPKEELSELKQGLPLPEVPETPKEKKRKGEKESYFSILAQGTSNSVFDAYSGSLGARFNPKKNLGFGASLDLGFGLDKLVDSYTGPLSCGRSAYGTVKDTDKLSIGSSLETQFGPFVLGTGIDYKTWITNTVEQIILDDCGNVIKSNTNAVPNRQVFAKVYGGAEIPLTKNWKIGAILGYNWKDGVYGGIRTGFKLNNRKRK